MDIINEIKKTLKKGNILEEVFKGTTNEKDDDERGREGGVVLSKGGGWVKRERWWCRMVLYPSPAPDMPSSNASFSFF